MYLFQIRIFREIALRTALVFVILGSVASSTQVLGHIFAMIDAGSNILVPLELFFYLIPTVAVMILPVAFLIACISTFDRMDDSWETIVLAATGVRPVTVVFPIILFALAISAFVLAISIYVEPIANKAERDKVVSFKVDALTLLASNGVMQKTQANLYIRGGALRDDGQIQDIFILDRRSPDDEVIYFAETGKIIKDQSRILLRLVDGSIQHHSHIDGTSYAMTSLYISRVRSRLLIWSPNLMRLRGVIRAKAKLERNLSGGLLTGSTLLCTSLWFCFLSMAWGSPGQPANGG